ncbi:hypothetical protein C2845_PM02G14000 [Panicum miliaceum]|uniref:Uncharacterized protein n=1 Tax=Panicum miliaceum TaxID=4540 RepID=A0A3L6S734_PANMI|nr:hypothetical protein C2845_PM02G14000 [Panicum miliaceum]
MGAKAWQLRVVVVVVGMGIVAAGAAEFAYDGFGGAGLALDGMATVTPAGLLQLTNDTTMPKGHAFHPEPVTFRRPVGSAGGGGAAAAAMPSFSTTFVFAIVSEFLDLSTSGFAFLAAPATDLSTAMPNQYLGMFNGTDNGDPRNRIFAVEFDTVRNPEFADINNNHVGVDVNSLNSSAAEPAGYYDDATGAFRNLSLISREPMQVWVDYDAATAEITVAMAPARSPRPKRPLLSKRIDLSTVITDTAYVGFSSASSIVLVKHYVLGWSFRLDGEAPALNYAKLPKLPRIGSKPPSRALAIALPIAAAAAALAALVVGLLLLRRRLRLHDHGADPQSTRVVGTMGYLAPELVRTGKASTLSDVFAFGVFLLEVACGRRPVEEDADTDTGDCFLLVDWVLGHWRNGSITSAVDARLGSHYDAAEVDLVLRLGLACLHPSPAARPSMRRVTQYLDGSAPLPELPATNMSFNSFVGMERYRPLFDSWSVRQTTAAMSVATMSDIGLSGGR